MSPSNCLSMVIRPTIASPVLSSSGVNFTSNVPIACSAIVSPVCPICVCLVVMHTTRLQPVVFQFHSYPRLLDNFLTPPGFSRWYFNFTANCKAFLIVGVKLKHHRLKPGGVSNFLLHL